MIWALTKKSLCRPNLLNSISRRRNSSYRRPIRPLNIIYGGIILGATGVFGSLLYFLAQDMLSESGTYKMIDQAVHRIEDDPRLIQMLGGLPLAVHGYNTLGSNGRAGRRRPIIHETYSPATGAKQLETSFFVKGPIETGRVIIRMVEDEAGGWKDQYFSVEIPGQPPYFLVRPPSQPSPMQRSPFKRFM